ncbi:MAG TPA: hypothetical protein ENG37_01950 [Firmicutes bacterium]|nr:hypothetical protein [Bacillota bacterium]
MKDEELNELKIILQNQISTAAFAGMIFNATLTEAGKEWDTQELIEHALRIKVKLREIMAENTIEEEVPDGYDEEEPKEELRR